MARLLCLHRSTEPRKFLDSIEQLSLRNDDLHLILDNYGTHKTALIRRWLAKRPRCHVHFTPSSASWINLVERWSAALTKRQILRGLYRTVSQLEAAIRQFLSLTNETPSRLFGARMRTRF